MSYGNLFGSQTYFVAIWCVFVAYAGHTCAQAPFDQPRFDQAPSDQAPFTQAPFTQAPSDQAPFSQPLPAVWTTNGPPMAATVAHTVNADRTELLLEDLQRQLAEQANEIAHLNDEVAIIGVPAAGYGVNEQEAPFTGEWDYGLWFETKEGFLRANVGGRLEQDWLWAEVGPALEARIGRIEDKVFFRRARLHGAGTLYGSVDYYLELELAPVERVVFQDAWVQLRDVPLAGYVRIGHIKPPIGMESLTSAKFIVFMERDAAHDAFLQEYDPGMMIWNYDDEKGLTWAMAMVRYDPDESGSSIGNGKYSGVARVAGIPWSMDCDEALVHVGCGFRYDNGGVLDSELGIDVVRFRARPEIRRTPRFVDTGPLTASGTSVVVGELAAKFGSLFVQSEYIHTKVSDASVAGGGPDLGDVAFDGAYVFASYLLTGEQRPYSRSSGTFGRIVPAENVRPGTGRFFLFQGAWELSSRYTHVDLNAPGVNGGVLQTVTTGLTWYLNPNTKVLMNYIWAQSVVPETVDNGTSNLFGLRFHASF